MAYAGRRLTRPAGTSRGPDRPARPPGATGFGQSGGRCECPGRPVTPCVAVRDGRAAAGAAGPTAPAGSDRSAVVPRHGADVASLVMRMAFARAPTDRRRDAAHRVHGRAPRGAAEGIRRPPLQARLDHRPRRPASRRPARRRPAPRRPARRRPARRRPAPCRPASCRPVPRRPARRRPASHRPAPHRPAPHRPAPRRSRRSTTPRARHPLPRALTDTGRPRGADAPPRTGRPAGADAPPWTGRPRAPRGRGGRGRRGLALTPRLP